MPLTQQMIDNAGLDVDVLGQIVNGTATIYGTGRVPLRLGGSTKTLAKVIADADAKAAELLENIGFEAPVAFAAGLNIVRSTQTVEYDGQVYAPVVAEIPFVTTAVFDPNQWRVIAGLTEAVMAAADGSAKVGHLAEGVGAIVQTVREALRQLPVYPESYGALRNGVALDGPAIQRAFDAADPAAGGNGHVRLRAGTYIVGGNIVMPPGTIISGPRGAVLKRMNQLTALLTSAIPGGTGEVSFTVASAAGFLPGMGIGAFQGDVMYPVDPYAHRARTIKSVVGNTITLNAGVPAMSTPNGATIFTTGFILCQTEDTVIDGITIDCNEGNNLYGDWRLSCAYGQEGSRGIRRGVRIINTTADAGLVGGPLDGGGNSTPTIFGSWDIDCEFNNIGGNGVHYGNCKDMWVVNCRMKDGNMRLNSPKVQGGGGGGGLREGHQDGAIIYSLGIYGLRAFGNEIENWICGVVAGNVGNGGTGLLPINDNDEILVANNTFRGCFSSWEVRAGARDIMIIGNRVFRDYPFSGSPIIRWQDSVSYVRGTYTSSGVNGGKMVRRCIVANNTMKNQRIEIDRLDGGIVIGNVCDMKDATATIGAGTTGSCIVFLNSQCTVVALNTCEGGAHGIYMQNSFAPDVQQLGRGNIIMGNTCRNNRQSGMTGAVGAGAFFESILTDNVMIGDSAGGTASTWVGMFPIIGMSIRANRFFFDGGTRQAYGSGNAAAKANRKDNMINGFYELLDVFADNAAAIAGSVPVGQFYRTATGQVMQRF